MKHVLRSDSRLARFQWAGLLALMETSEDVTGPVNLGNADEFTMLELAKKVLELTGSAAKLVFRELPSDDPKSRKPDISYAQECLGWTPSVALQDGLKKTIEYFDRLLSATAR